MFKRKSCSRLTNYQKMQSQISTRLSLSRKNVKHSPLCVACLFMHISIYLPTATPEQAQRDRRAVGYDDVHQARSCYVYTCAVQIKEEALYGRISAAILHSLPFRAWRFSAKIFVLSVQVQRVRVHVSVRTNLLTWQSSFSQAMHFWGIFEELMLVQMMQCC